MSIRTLHYVVCNQCTSAYGSEADTEQEAKEQAHDEGFVINVLVENGSLWDFCPKCQEKETVKTLLKKKTKVR